MCSLNHLIGVLWSTQEYFTYTLQLGILCYCSQQMSQQEHRSRNKSLGFHYAPQTASYLPFMYPVVPMIPQAKCHWFLQSIMAKIKQQKPEGANILKSETSLHVQGLAF